MIMDAMEDYINVLFAEDDYDDRFLFEEALASGAVKANITFFENGLELVNHLRSITAIPDIIFVDAMMPIKGGHECISEIRANEKFKNVPVVLLTISKRQWDIESAFAEGANLFLSKTVGFDNNGSFLKNLFSGNWKDKLLHSNRGNFVAG